MSEYEKESMIEDLLAGFDAEENETDRRIFYEVTGRQLIQGEFNDMGAPDEESRTKKALDAQFLNFPDDDKG